MTLANFSHPVFQRNTITTSAKIAMDTKANMACDLRLLTFISVSGESGELMVAEPVTSLMYNCNALHIMYPIKKDDMAVHSEEITVSFSVDEFFESPKGIINLHTSSTYVNTIQREK